MKIQKTDAGKGTVRKKRKLQKSFLFPVGQRSVDIFFRVLQRVCNFSQRNIPSCGNHAQQIEIELHIFAVCLRQIMVDKFVGDTGDAGVDVCM